jgi:hypothetical protein
MTRPACFRAVLITVASMLLVACASNALGQGYISREALRQRPCLSFQRCLDHCNAIGGTGGTDRSCGNICAAQNCGSDTSVGSRQHPLQAQAGRCADALEKCQANCTRVTGNPNCGATGCEKLHAKCMVTGCWIGPNSHTCGLARE